MAEDIVETVADAIEKAHTEYHPTKRDYAEMARAAIAAMREPTEGMKGAAVPQPDFPVLDEVVQGCRNIAGRYWRAMIDAALKD